MNKATVNHSGEGTNKVTIEDPKKKEVTQGEAIACAACGVIFVIVCILIVSWFFSACDRFFEPMTDAERAQFEKEQEEFEQNWYNYQRKAEEDQAMYDALKEIERSNNYYNDQ